MDKDRIAVVTGSNTGIGFEVAKELSELNGIKVILTARDEKKGLEAQKKIKTDFFLLDVASEKSIKNLYDFVLEKYGRIDILVNNAGILIDEDKSGLNTEIDSIKKTLETNLYGPIRLCQTFIPLMQKNNYGRIVNFSSGLGSLNEMGSGYFAYRTSKAAINVLTRVFSSELSGTNILINSMSPGWVKTKMGGPNAPRTVEQGADTAVWLATLPDSGPTGKFFSDRKEISW